MNNKSVSDFVAATMDAVLNSKEHKSLFGTQYKYAAKSKSSKSKMCAKCKCRLDECECGDMSMADDDYMDESMMEEEDYVRPSKSPNVPDYGPSSVDEDFDRPATSDFDDPYELYKSEYEKDEDFYVPEAKEDIEQFGLRRKHMPPHMGRIRKEDKDLYSEIHGSEDDDEKYFDYSIAGKYEDKGEDELEANASFNKAIKSLLTASAALDAVNMVNSSAVSLKLASLIVQAKKVKEKEEKSKKTNKAKKKNKKLTSADFKKMHEEDADGKLTSANFKKLRQSK